jgi:hypothetical protein
MDICSRVYAFFANLVKTNQASVVEVSDLDACTHDANVSKNECACDCPAQEDKKNPLDLSEITEKVDEVLHLLEEASVKDEEEDPSNFYDEEEVDKNKDNNILLRMSLVP